MKNIIGEEVLSKIPNR